jgi:hypothetical protein
VREPDWNYGEIRQRKAAFFIDVMKDDPELYARVAAAVAADGGAFNAASLTDEQIDSICRKKAFLYKQERYGGIDLCPQMKEKLGAILSAAVQDEVKIRNYLETVLPQAAGQRNHVASVYIYGHTHRAVPPPSQPLNIVSPFGVDPIEYANTGAFQRLATPAQLSAISTIKARSKPAGAAVTIEPDDLPACYNYVFVPAYAGKPRSQLLKWYVAADGKFTSGSGKCLE